MKITVLTLFPEYFKSILKTSIIRRAQNKDFVSFEIVNIRDYAQDKHQITDERPFGGGPGMVMKVEPIDLALHSLGVQKNSNKTRIILTSAKGRTFDQRVAQNYSKLEELIIICGHYEGVDERVAKYLVDEEVRIGDYVLTGGESAAAVIFDAVTRLIPGVLGNEQSTEGESHSELGQFAHPVYTRPADYKGWKVPEVLLSGDHKKISSWRGGRRKS